MANNLQFGITANFPCSYLADEQERLLVAVDERLHHSDAYSGLMAVGFRRSGDQIYKPHCENCSACQSVRVLTKEFKLSSSQKRCWKKNKNLRVVFQTTESDHYYPLYEKYINAIHQDGSMYPANKEQYKQFIHCHFMPQLFIELWFESTLISVAVTDVLLDGLSAVYTFYDPDYRHLGLGVYSILTQINVCQLLNKSYLYLGYQIDACKKMNYKDKYHPFQQLINNEWQLISK